MPSYNFELDVTGYPDDLDILYVTVFTSDGWESGGSGDSDFEVQSPPNGGTVSFVMDQNTSVGGIPYDENASVWFTIEGEDSSGLGYPAFKVTIGPYPIADIGLQPWL